jgi:hypothetical protein
VATEFKKLCNIVVCPLKASILEPPKAAVSRERLRKRHVSVATVAQATMEVPLGRVFSVLSAPTATSSNYRVTTRRSVFCRVRAEIAKGEAMGALSSETVGLQAVSLRKEVLGPG